MKPSKGQIVAFPHEGANRVWTVQGISTLQDGKTVKVWFMAWEPGKTHVHDVKFESGEYEAPYRPLDLYDPAALMERAEKAVALNRATQTDRGVALAALRSIFAGAS